MRIIDTPELWQVNFNSWEEFIDASINLSSSIMSAKRSSRDPNRMLFTGTNTFDEAVELARVGLPKLGKKIMDLSAKVTSAIVSKIPKPDVGFDVQGQVIDMGKYVSGEPECCLNINTPDNGQKRVVDILMTQTASVGVDSSRTERRGIAICAVVRSLEMLGISCRIWITTSHTGSGADIRQFTKLKDFGEPLMMNRLAFAFCHSAVHRRLGFSIAECAPVDIREKVDILGLGSSYGTAEDLLKNWNEDRHIPVKNGYLYFKTADNMGQIDSDENAIEWAENTVKSQLK